MDTQHGCAEVAGITVYFDEDHDERVVPVVRVLIAALDYRGFPNVVDAVQEHEGALTVRLNPSFRRSNTQLLNNLIEKLVGTFSDLIVCDFWATEFEE